MRKFTKEIASLLATVTVGLSVNTGSAASEECVKLEGEFTTPDGFTDSVPEELVPTAGVAINQDITNGTTTTTAMIGTTTATRTTATTYGCIGTTITTTEATETTTTTTTGLIGTSIATPEEIVTTTTEEIPPLAGLLAPPDGDANCDGDTDMSDAVLVMQSLANPNKYGIDGTAENHLTVNGKYNADMDGDGLTVGDAQAIQKKLLGIE